MTVNELRQHPEYTSAMRKIRGYSKGFKFTIPYYKMNNGQRNAMRIIIKDAERDGLIESISIGVSLAGEFTEETFKRL